MNRLGDSGVNRLGDSGVNRLGDSGVNRLGDTSAFVNPAGQLLSPGGVRPEWMASA